MIKIFKSKTGKIYLKKKEKNKQDLILRLDLDVYDVVLREGLIFFYPKKTNGKTKNKIDDFEKEEEYGRDFAANI